MCCCCFCVCRWLGWNSKKSWQKRCRASMTFHCVLRRPRGGCLYACPHVSLLPGLLFSFSTNVVLPPYKISLPLSPHRAWQTLTTPRGKGRPMSVAFEQYVRGILATGFSAKAARGTVSMSAKTFLSPERFKQMELVLPLERWFRSQREGIGCEAWTYAMIRVAGASKILQWGFDETKLDGISTINQSVLLTNNSNVPEVVAIEAAGLLVGGTAAQIAEHICAAKLARWARGCCSGS